VRTERYQGGNLLIDGLPAPDRDRVTASLEVFQAEVPECIVSHGQEFEDVLFPIDAIFSVTAELRLGHVYEVAAIGRQGVIEVLEPAMSDEEKQGLELSAARLKETVRKYLRAG